MANLNWTKESYGYRAEGEHGTYVAQRVSGKFQLVVDGEDLCQPRTYAAVKEMAQSVENDRETRSAMVGADVPAPKQPTMNVAATVEEDENPLDGMKVEERHQLAFAGTPEASRLRRIEEKYSTEEGATEDERKEANQIVSTFASSLQADLAEKPKNGVPHLIIEARAGTGKTTTLVEGLKRIKGIPSSIIPSPQQEAVWKSMELSASSAKSICFVAFNKSIATELQRRVPQGCDAMTMHSMGFKAVQKTFGRLEPNSYVVSDIISELLEVDCRELRRERPNLLNATEKLVSLCKMNLVEADEQTLAELADYYEIDLNGDRAEVFGLVPRVLEECKNPVKRRKITFDDMIWLPVVLNLPVYRYDLLLVDEAQDLNRCQQALAKMAGRRLILCGDPKQAIYGFAGADSRSMDRMMDELSETPVGCVKLPLTVTRRCGKAIVAEANRIVPDFSAFETNGEGTILHAAYKADKGATSYDTMVAEGDMVLCRVNAPLVSQCFRFLRAGRKANIQGRDIGQGLISLVKKMKADSVEELVGKISDWCHKESVKETAKRNPSEAKLIAIQDRADCLVCFTEGAETVYDVIRKIESIFTDDKDRPGIRLSSIHKAKGLESHRVFLLQPEGATVPHPCARSSWQREQEYNLLYVAITRAIEQLVYVS